MERGERIGLGIAVAGHVLLFGALSIGLLTAPKPLPKLNDPVDVQLVDAIGLRSEAPQVTQEAPAPSEAPEVGPPEEAAPAEPEPAPPAPEPTPPPPAPVPKPAVKPAPAPKPVPKPVAEPTPKPAAPAPPKAKPAPAKAAPAKATPAKAAPAKAAPGKAAPGKGTAPKARGGAIGDDFLKGITPERSAGKAQTPRAAVVGQAQMNGLAAAIKRQVQPCYERKGVVGPGAERIITVLRLRFKPDGTLAGRPTRSDQTGVDDANGRYATRAAEVAIASVMECTPLKLPAELYENGWEDIEAGFSQIAPR